MIRRKRRSNKYLIDIYTRFITHRMRDNVVKELFSLHDSNSPTIEENLSIKSPVQFQFSQELLNNYKSFYLNKNVQLNRENLLINGKTLKEVGSLKSGTYGQLTVFERNIVLKEFETTSNFVEEIMISHLINSNKLPNTIPILPILNKDHALIMPQVQSDLENFYQLMTSSAETVQSMDKTTFDIIHCVLDCLVKYSKKSLYYTDLKLANLLVLLTSANEFRVIFGDIGSFVYLKKDWKGFGSDVATYPPPNSQLNKNVMSLGHILPNRRKNIDKDLLKKLEDHGYMSKTMTWIFGAFIVNLFYILMHRKSRRRYNSFFLYGNIIHSTKKEVEDKVKIELTKYQKFFQDHKCKYLLSIVNVLPKILRYNNSERIGLDEIFI